MTKVLFIKDSKSPPVPYDPETHAQLTQKFLVWNDLIIAGPQEVHRKLYEAYESVSENPHPIDGLVGAGDSFFKIISFWFSSGYRVFTPDERKPEILKPLGMNELRQ